MHILDVLERLHGSRTHAARALEVSLRTLRNKLAAYRDLGMTIPSNAQWGPRKADPLKDERPVSSCHGCAGCRCGCKGLFP